MEGIRGPSAAGWLAAAGVILCASACHAGAPLFSDDPAPTPLHHFEIYSPFTLERSPGETGFEFPGIDLNYGAAPNVQLAVEGAIAWDEPPPNSARRAHPGDLTVQAKYLLFQRGQEHHVFQFATYPKIVVPSTTTWNTVAFESVDYVVPVLWLQEWGEKTRVYGDVHATLPHDEDAPRQAFVGLAFERDVAPRVTLTGEAYTETAAEAHHRDVVGFSLGIIREIKRYPNDEDHHVDVLLSVGHAWFGGPDLTVYFGPRFMFHRL